MRLEDSHKSMIVINCVQVNGFSPMMLGMHVFMFLTFFIELASKERKVFKAGNDVLLILRVFEANVFVFAWFDVFFKISVFVSTFRREPIVRRNCSEDSSCLSSVVCDVQRMFWDSFVEPGRNILDLL